MNVVPTSNTVARYTEPPAILVRFSIGAFTKFRATLSGATAKVLIAILGRYTRRLFRYSLT
jgi:hypothetical protein